MNMSALGAGFLLALSLLVAVGPQNAFVLRQGLRREHVFVVCLTCALSDIALISIGVGGFGYLVEAVPHLVDLLLYAGAAFLFVYGALSFRAAFVKTETLEPYEGVTGSWQAAVLTSLAFIWINPHVYLDTVGVMGPVSASYGDARLSFWLGAVIASAGFFFSLGYGARLLAPVFAKSGAWRVLDVFVGCVMWVIALNLILGPGDIH